MPISSHRNFFEYISRNLFDGFSDEKGTMRFRFINETTVRISGAVYSDSVEEAKEQVSKLGLLLSASLDTDKIPPIAPGIPTSGVGLDPIRLGNPKHEIYIWDDNEEK